MNPGKKLIRNTLFCMWGTMAFFIGWNRLYSSTLDETGEGSRLLTLGLRANTEPQAEAELDLAQARDFTHLSVRGPLRVVVQGAPDYKVSFTPAAGQNQKVHAWMENGSLHVNAGNGRDDALSGELLVQVPTLARIEVAVPDFVVRGIKADELSVALYWKGEARLEQNQVSRWRMFAAEDVEVQVDDATFAAGALRAAGNVTLRRAVTAR